MENNIHFIVLGDHRPDWADANIELFRRLNPDWVAMVHAEDFDMHESYREALKVARTVGGQSDILRFAVLEAFGGWYFDWDVYPIRPIEDTQSNAMIDNKLLLWTCPQTNGMLMSSICAAGRDSIAWPIIHGLMDDISQGKSPDPDVFDPNYYEMFICTTMRKLHSDKITSGVFEEFTITERYEPDKELYRKLLAGAVVDTKQCAFLHGWATMSKGPAIRVNHDRK
jgi:hypothetical protein